MGIAGVNYMLQHKSFGEDIQHGFFVSEDEAHLIFITHAFVNHHELEMLKTAAECQPLVRTIYALPHEAALDPAKMDWVKSYYPPQDCVEVKQV